MARETACNTKFIQNNISRTHMSSVLHASCVVVCETVTVPVVCETINLQVHGRIRQDDFTNPSSGRVPPGSVKDWGLWRFSSGGGKSSLL